MCIYMCVVFCVRICLRASARVVPLSAFICAKTHADACTESRRGALGGTANIRQQPRFKAFAGGSRLGSMFC